MRNSYWLVVSLLVLECVVLLIQPSECFLSFIPVSVHTALQVLTLLVKIKSIIFKILLGLKLMGVEGFIMRRRKRSIALMDAAGGDISEDTNSKSYLDWKLGSLPESQRTELLLAWERLEKLLGEKVRFQEDVCIEAMQKYGKRPVSVWAEGAYLGNENDKEKIDASSSNGSNNNINGEGGENELEQVSKWNYSYWISTVLGSALGSPYACHILEKQLNFNDKPTAISNSSLTNSYEIPDQVVDNTKNITVTLSPSLNSKDNSIASSLQSGAFS